MANDPELTNEQIRAEIAKLIAETAKINAEARWYPYIVVATVVGGVVGIVKVFGGL